VGREVYSGNITQDSWTEPDPRPRIVQFVGRGNNSNLPVIRSVILSVRYFVVCGGRVVSPRFLRHYLPGNGLFLMGEMSYRVNFPDEWVKSTSKSCRFRISESGGRVSTLFSLAFSSSVISTLTFATVDWSTGPRLQYNASD